MSERRRSYRPALPTEPPPSDIRPPLPPTTPALEARVAELVEQRADLRYTVKGFIAANQQMAARVAELEADPRMALTEGDLRNARDAVDAFRTRHPERLYPTLDRLNETLAALAAKNGDTT